MTGFLTEWTRYQERWPHREQKSDRPALSRAAECELDLGYEAIESAESHITSSLLEIESEVSNRRLVGFDFRLKSLGRIAEKVSQNIASKPDRTPEAALGLIPDAVRYTLCYNVDDYAPGVRSDLDRLKAAGFEMLKVRNLWGQPEYRGINSQWRDMQTGQRFEVQFHTLPSFEAKQVTHGAYELLRTGELNDDEELELDAFQRKVTAAIPMPPGALDIPDHSRSE
jgi:hypothetical protein